MSTFLSQDWAGLVIAAVVAALGWGIWRWRRRRKTGLAILGLGALLAVGAVCHLIGTARMNSRFPPPGKLVDVGGFRLHVLAEGHSTGTSSVVFIPGSHSSGYGLYHLHQALKHETRSILFDRAGSGWSDPGPFPRSTLQEVEEMRRALHGAGERGPFVFVGHSYGGLLAVNYAYRHPEDVAGLVLLDATHPDYFVYSPAGWVSATVILTRTSGIAHLFGIDLTDWVYGKALKQSALYRTIKSELANVWDAYVENESQPRASFATASLFTEIQTLPLTPILVRDGDLGDLPVALAFATGPKCGSDVQGPCPAVFTPIIKDFIRSTGLTERDYRRQNDMMGIISRKYGRISSNSFIRFAPPGTSHNFPYEAPDFTLGVIREELATIAAARTASPTSP